jgi:hypothetical protein
LRSSRAGLSALLSLALSVQVSEFMRYPESWGVIAYMKLRGLGIFDRYNGEFSTGIDTKLDVRQD